MRRHGRDVLTSIWKEPVPGHVRVLGVNVDGDEQADPRVHGGPAKAVYAYAAEDTAWWAHELGEALGAGTFGENLTLEGVDVSGARTGERWRVGSALLEVTDPRLPCWKLETKLGRRGFIDTFIAGGRPGAYLRIVEPGDVGAGDPVVVVTRTSAPTMAERMRSMTTKQKAVPT